VRAGRFARLAGVPIWQGAGKSWVALAVTAEGVYADVQASAGLWFLPFTGTARQIAATGYWQAVGGGAAYGTAASGVPPGESNPILRLDLNTLASVPWFEVAGGSSPLVLGFDSSGSPLMLVNTGGQFGGNTIWSVPSVGHATVLAFLSSYYNKYQVAFNQNGAPVGDSHGIWFGTQQGTFLFTPNAPYPWWYEASTVSGQVAGGCG